MMLYCQLNATELFVVSCNINCMISAIVYYILDCPCLFRKQIAVKVDLSQYHFSLPAGMYQDMDWILICWSLDLTLCGNNI